MGKKHAKSFAYTSHIRRWVIGVLVFGLACMGVGFVQPHSLSVSADTYRSVTQATPNQVASHALSLKEVIALSARATEIPKAIAKPSEPEALSASEQKAIISPPEVPIQLLYPDVGITQMLVLPMDGRSEVLDPPLDNNAHWLNNFGLVGQGSAHSAYIIAHSCGLGYPNCSVQTFPFNNLSTRAGPGQVITIVTASGVVHYRVTEVVDYTKHSTLAEKRGVWNVVPDRLVLISCNTADLLGSNVAVFAQLEK